MTEPATDADFIYFDDEEPEELRRPATVAAVQSSSTARAIEALQLAEALLQWGEADPHRLAVIRRLLGRDQRAVCQIAKDAGLDRFRVPHTSHDPSRPINKGSTDFDRTKDIEYV